MPGFPLISFSKLCCIPTLSFRFIRNEKLNLQSAPTRMPEFSLSSSNSIQSIFNEEAATEKVVLLVSPQFGVPFIVSSTVSS